MQLAGRPAGKAAPPPRAAPPHMGPGPVMRAPAPVRAPAPPREARVGPPPHPVSAGAHGAPYRVSNAGYKQAVIDTYKRQPPATQAKIRTAAVRNPRSFEADTILKYLQRSQPAITGGAGRGMGVSASLLQSAKPGGLPKVLSEAGTGLRNVLGQSAGAPNAKGASGEAAISGALFGGSSGGKTLLENLGKDAIDLPAQTFSTLGTVGSDIAHGQIGKAASMFIDPYKQLLANPVKSFYAHPLDTYLMATAPAHGVTRVAAGAVRELAPESTLGKALSTERPPIKLHGKLTHERPRYSPYPGIKAGQVAVERALYKRAPTGELIPKDPKLAAKLTGLNVSRIIGLNERIRSANRDQAIATRVKAITHPSVAKRLAAGIKGQVKYDPGKLFAPGHEVLARIADGTLRTPESFQRDLRAHIDMVSRNRADLLDAPKEELAQHDKYVADLKKVEAAHLSPTDLKTAFEAAHAYAKDYLPLQEEAHALGHFGQRTRDALLKRALSHYAISHMEASYDPALNEGQGGMVDQNGHLLTTGEIARHASKNGRGTKTIAFTSDKPHGNVFYLSSERRPLPEMARSTMFNYSHGLTDASHEALLRQHVRMQGIVDSHKAMNRLLETIGITKPDGTPWSSYAEAKRAGGSELKPIALAEPFHPQQSLDDALEGVNPLSLEADAATHSMDLTGRLTDQGQGRWALADPTALRRIEQHKNQIGSIPGLRAFKMTNNQFRQVALGTSPKHIPGVIQESLIRDISSGIGVSSWITGRRLINRATELNPEQGRIARAQLTGGTVAGSTVSMMTRQVSDHFAGTDLHGPLRAFESFMRAPGPRQMRFLWKSWLRLAINGTKRVVEENHQTAGLGKAALQDFAGEHGMFAKALRLQGSMLDDAAKGLFDEQKLRALRAQIERFDGRWTDLSPNGQLGLMMSPFGLWWTNSVKWLLRSPTDRPIQSGALAAATVGTQNQRYQTGQDLFAPNAVPPYMQGAIGLGGGKFLAQNYYSPFGVANDPVQTGAGLMEPWLQTPLLAALGDNYLGKPLTSPTNPKGYKPTNTGEKIAVIVNSLLASFLPLYSKAETIAEGGSSPYDSSTLLNPQTKTPGHGFAAGLQKATQPYRLYHNKSSSGGYLLPPASSGYLLGNSSGSGYLLP